MFCPGCAVQVSDDLKFCRQCGANLRGVREAMVSNPNKGPNEGKSDKSQTWWADIARAHAMKEFGIGLSPEEKRINEIKSGVIITFVGVGVMILLRLFPDALANKNPHDAELIHSLWVLGIIPFMAGIGIIFNSLFISRWLGKLKEKQSQSAAPASQAPAALPAKTTDHLVVDPAPPGGASVTEDTTAHLP
jgi:hypothetical protein